MRQVQNMSMVKDGIDSVDGNGSADANGTVNYLVSESIRSHTLTRTRETAVPVTRMIKVEDNDTTSDHFDW